MDLLVAINNLNTRTKSDVGPFEWRYETPVARFLHDSRRAIGKIVTVSRINYKPDLFNFTVAGVKVTDLKPTTLPFGYICDARAAQVLKALNASGLPYLNVLWSGGIDSTVALTSLLRMWSRADLERVRVIMSEHSRREYPRFWLEHIKGRFQTIEIKERLTTYDSFFDDSMVLTGEFGDQLFGSDIVERVSGFFHGVAKMRERPYHVALKQYYAYAIGPKRAVRFLDHYFPIVEESPVPIRDAFDFLWWWNFTQKWQYVKFRTLMFSTAENVSRNFQRTFHFFESEDFQRWSISNHDKKLPGEWVTYKLPAKQYLEAFTGDTAYTQNKGKVQSLKNIFPGRHLATALGEGLELIDAERLMEFRRPEFSYGKV